jgi:Ser-tRNA(Ala) deacylase AlaX
VLSPAAPPAVTPEAGAARPPAPVARLDPLLPCQAAAPALAGPAEVRSCAPHPAGGFAITLSETLFYPEGGGQPADHGQIGGVAVIDVQRVDGVVVHRTEAPLPTGPTTQAVDPARRRDHAQQHSAQHLISALALRTFGRATVGFHLGALDATVDLDGPLPPGGLEALRAATTAAIAADHPLRVIVVDAEELAARGARVRGLPPALRGPVRLIEIDGLDLNTCGGTHVDRTGALQLVQLFAPEPLRGGLRLRFRAGGRAAAALDQHEATLTALSARLKVPQDALSAAVERLAADRDAAARAADALEDDLADAILAAHSGALALLDLPRAGAGLVLALGKRLAAAPGAAVIGADSLLLLGTCAAAGPAVVAALGAGGAACKGGGGKGRFQAKGGPWSGKARAAALGCVGG